MEECCKCFFLFFLGMGQNCGHFGHIARVCPNEAPQDFAFASRAPPPGRGLNMASLPPIKCYRCGGPNHMARYVVPSSECIPSSSFFTLVTCSDCLAPPYSTTEDMNGVKEPVETCYKCKEPGHVCVSHLRSTMSSWVLVMYILCCL